MSVSASLSAKRLFSDLSLKWKITSVIIPLIMAILLLGYVLIRDKGQEIEFTQKETYGVEYNHALRDLMQTFMEHRGLASLYLNGSKAKAQLEQKQEQIRARIKVVEEAEAQYGATLGTLERWRNIQAHWEQLQRQLINLSPAESIARHSALVGQIIDLMAKVGHSSNLTLDSHTDSYYLIDTVQNQLSNLIETIGIMRATAVKAAENPQANGKDKVALISLQQIADLYKGQIEKNIRTITKNTPALQAGLNQPADAFSAASNRFFNLINKNLLLETNHNQSGASPEKATDVSAVAIYNAATKAVNAGFHLFDAASASLGEILAERIAKIRKEQYLAFGGMGLFILFARGIGFIVISAIVRPIQKAEAASNAIAEGHLDNVIESKSNDEVGRMLDSLGEMQNKLRQQIEKERHHFQEQALLLKELEEKNTELERFIYTVSHDLRSPLITIQGFSGMLKRSIDQGNIERMQEDIERIHAAADRMHSLLDDLLELSRIGRLVNVPERFFLEELAKEAIELTQGTINRRGVQVTLVPPLPVLFGDRRRFLEVMQNLIENAVKFMGAQPAPWIKIGGEEKQGEILCYVQDNGIGINPRYHEKIFELFERLDQNEEGSGIGLAIVKRIIEVHTGRIWVESEGRPGQGSTFYFSIPRDSTHNER